MSDKRNLKHQFKFFYESRHTTNKNECNANNILIKVTGMAEISFKRTKPFDTKFSEINQNYQNRNRDQRPVGKRSRIQR